MIIRPAENHCISGLDLAGGIGNDPSVLVTHWSALAEFNLIRQADDPPPFAFFWTSKLSCLANSSVQSLLLTMSPILLLITALLCGWLVWTFWFKASPAERLPGIPLVKFTRDNSREQYISDATSLSGKGYDMVEPYCHLSIALLLIQD